MADAKTERGAKAPRPLSPHLQVYRPLINMVMSILHRMTGAALYLGTLLVAWVLAAAASGPEYYAFVTGLLGSWPGKVVLFGYTWAIFHHMAGGVRHFIWDTGHGYDLETIDMLSWGTALISAVATLGLWAYILISG
ncbi:MAG: succinate dehydrogenase, cytochrome b556 subunit [Hyphomicrobium sp.]|jgi:succinate dehydrogenase / fumarate reductase cytochrome b subunit